MVRMKIARFALLLLAAFTFAAQGADSDMSAADAADVGDADARYTFSWQFTPDGVAKPRGGTTRGAPVTLETAPSPAWRALQESGLSAFERDRRAILAMAGDYRVTFDFLEIETFAPATARARPYQSWGTERVYVEADDGRHISLVHILEMRFLQADGSVSEPMVTKHWRQSWRYEPDEIVEYKGRERWQQRKLDRIERAGRWSQTVYQVDESPRYASTGKWNHSASFSDWLSDETWRPLPRREWSVRKDYEVLVGTNRHTITATGWIQEENNLKTVLTADRRVNASQPHVAREYGIARYERLRDADFDAADRYHERTRAFWDEVLDAWSEAFDRLETITLRARVDESGLFAATFAHADRLAANEPTEKSPQAVIRESMQAMGVAVARDSQESSQR